MALLRDALKFDRSRFEFGMRSEKCESARVDVELEIANDEIKQDLLDDVWHATQTWYFCGRTSRLAWRCEELPAVKAEDGDFIYEKLGDWLKGK